MSRKRLLVFVFIGISMVASLFLFGKRYMDKKSYVDVEISDKKFRLEVAKTPGERRRGLMGRRHLDANSGMLFLFDNESFYPFWMKNTLIPLDIIWIDKNKKVVFIAENVQPCKNALDAFCKSIFPRAKALYVVELNAGKVDEINLKIGDSVKF